MTSDEITGNRDLKYSLWHRVSSGHLSDRCKCINIDFLEIRDDKPVAFIEIAETRLPLEVYPFRYKFYHAKTLSKLTQMSRIPSYIVIHNEDLKRFKVYFSLPTDKFIIMSDTQYASWLESLR